MSVDMEVVNLSRLQFGVTAMYHFLFVPLTLGLSWLLVIMESVYVMTGKVVYRDMVQFWGKLFGINFAMGVTTGITLEFQFGTNWAYYSHYVGDVFGVPLAIEGLMAFFLESTFVGLFFFGWDRLGRVQHLGVTFLVALGSSLSALWILIANGWMNNPVGAEFNFETMRMELVSISDVIFNPVAHGPSKSLSDLQRSERFGLLARSFTRRPSALRWKNGDTSTHHPGREALQVQSFPCGFRSVWPATRCCCLRSGINDCVFLFEALTGVTARTGTPDI